MKSKTLIKDRHHKTNRKKSYDAEMKFLKDQLSRNVINLTEYKFQIEFNKGRYGQK